MSRMPGLQSVASLPDAIRGYVDATWPTLAALARRVRGNDGLLYTRVYDEHGNHVGTVRDGGWVTDDALDWDLGISDSD